MRILFSAMLVLIATASFAQQSRKEKKAAKQAKKHAGDVVPMVVKGS